MVWVTRANSSCDNCVLIIVDQSSELGQALKNSQLQLADTLAECQHLKVELKSLREQLEEAQAAAQVSAILNQELEEKESRLIDVSRESMYICMYVCVLRMSHGKICCCHHQVPTITVAISIVVATCMYFLQLKLHSLLTSE